jgi:hypothetical protein
VTFTTKITKTTKRDSEALEIPPGSKEAIQKGVRGAPEFWILNSGFSSSVS